MITNLLATIIVSLVTNTVENVTEWDHMEPTPCDHPPQQMWGGYGFYQGCLVAHMKGVGPKRKERITTIKEVSTLTFDWMGAKREIPSERVVSETREAFALEWNRAELKKADPLQGSINIGGGIFLTNRAWIGVTNKSALDTLELDAK
jgi:hypothetical protein